MKKIVDGLKNFLSFVIVLGMVFGAGYYLGKNANENESIAVAEETNDFDVKLPLEKEKRVVTVEEVESKLAEIGELSTYSGEYTSTLSKDETRYWLEKIPVLGSTNSIEVTGKGIVKIGYNISEVGVKVDNNKIYISIPEAQLNDNYIIWDSVECKESNNILNPIEFDQYQEIIQDIESKGLQDVTANGIYQSAEDNFKVLIEAFLADFDGYEIEYM